MIDRKQLECASISMKLLYLWRMIKRILSGVLLLVISQLTSCRIDGEVGVAKVYIQNSTNDPLKVEVAYRTTENNFCNSCIISASEHFLIGSQGDIGASPDPQKFISSIKIYRNDSLKISSLAPFDDLHLAFEKGEKKYDKNFTFTINSTDIH